MTTGRINQNAFGSELKTRLDTTQHTRGHSTSALTCMTRAHQSQQDPDTTCPPSAKPKPTTEGALSFGFIRSQTKAKQTTKQRIRFFPPSDQSSRRNPFSFHLSFNRSEKFSAHPAPPAPSASALVYSNGRRIVAVKKGDNPLARLHRESTSHRGNGASRATSQSGRRKRATRTARGPTFL